jgi:hypothetical protein
MTQSKRVWALAGWCVVAVLGAGAAWTIVETATPGRSQDDPLAELRSPTPDVVTEAPSITEGEEYLASNPNVEEVARAILTSDSDLYLRHVPSTTGPCERFSTRTLDRCAQLGVPAGADVTMYAQQAEAIPGFFELEDTVRANFEYLTSGRNPRLAAVASRQDGYVSLVVMVDPRPGLAFPDRTPLGGDDIAIFTTVSPSGEVKVFSSGGRGSPPLEWVRAAKAQGNPYTIRGVSSEFVEWAREQHDETTITDTAP